MTSDAKPGLIYQKIPLIMKGLPVIGKDQENAMQHYMFRGIDDVYNAAHDVLAEHGVFCVPTVIGVEREERTSSKGGLLIYSILTVEHRFIAEDGSFVMSTTIGESMDSGDKASNKAMSAAMKVAFLQIFCIPTEEAGKDTEGGSPTPIAKGKSAPKATPPKATASSTGAPTCGKCLKPMKKRTSAKGDFWGCSGYPECKNTMDIGQEEPKPDGPEPINAWWARIATKIKGCGVTQARVKPWVLGMWEVTTTSDLTIDQRAAIEAIVDDTEQLLTVLAGFEGQGGGDGFTLEPEEA